MNDTPEQNNGEDKSLDGLAQASSDKDFAAKLAAIFEDAVNLTVTTKITEGDEQIKTTINLLDGDITNEINKNYIAQDKVADFHSQQVAKAEQIIQTNINTLKELATTIKSMV